jgi:hypothetical protein
MMMKSVTLSHCHILASMDHLNLDGREKNFPQPLDQPMNETGNSVAGTLPD